MKGIYFIDRYFKISSLAKTVCFIWNARLFINVNGSLCKPFIICTVDVLRSLCERIQCNQRANQGQIPCDNKEEKVAGFPILCAKFKFNIAQNHSSSYRSGFFFQALVSVPIYTIHLLQKQCVISNPFAKRETPFYVCFDWYEWNKIKIPTKDTHCVRCFYFFHSCSKLRFFTFRHKSQMSRFYILTLQ